MTRESKGKRVLVALSGGVDSSVAAALLQEAGYQVEGAIMILEGMQEENVGFARAAAGQLNIPFHRFDFRKQHEERVIDYFVSEYQLGRTPNPCVVCNKIIKFSLFMEKAREMGIDLMATGHYAGIEHENGRYLLKKGVDNNEQSYFLYRLEQTQLAQTLFPLGQYTKEQVRAVAHKHNLPTAKRKKSQDVCFIPDGDYGSFLKERMAARPGPILDNIGHQIGEHNGIIHFTIGQRHGIRISHKHPYYVTKIDADKNAIYIGEKQEVYKQQFIARDLHFIPFDTLEHSMKVSAKVRYFSPLSEAIIEPFGKDQVKVVFKKPQWAITPGQSVVLYRENLVVGGGIIERVIDKEPIVHSSPDMLKENTDCSKNHKTPPY